MEVAQKIKNCQGGKIHGLKKRVKNADVMFEDTKMHLQNIFSEGNTIVAVMASGAVIRLLAQVVQDKINEPPVIIIDEKGKYIVPLLGGHKGGNKIAEKLAGKIGGVGVITTAGDNQFGIALDEPPKGWVLGNEENYKNFMGELLAGEQVELDEEAQKTKWITQSKLPVARVPDTVCDSVGDTAKLKIKIAVSPTLDNEKENGNTLVYHPKKLVMGIGCQRGVGTQKMMEIIKETLKNENIALQSVACIASVDIKADEIAINEVARKLNIPTRFFEAKILQKEKKRLRNPSQIVFEEVGCHGVCEGAALAAVGENGKLIMQKKKKNGITIAIAQSQSIVEVEQCGRARGKISVVGIGPGGEEWCSPEVSKLIADAQDIVGYTLYLELVARKTNGKKIHGFALGKEKDRVIHALELAGEGRNVALVCSGDAGIYAMASLVFEVMEKNKISENAKRVEVQVAAGISAVQAAAANVGAPIGHDYCTISLSDLLTPWEQIEKRIMAAAKGDFVIAFYNPVSQRRKTQLQCAKEILLQERSHDTPVVIAGNLGREKQKIKIVKLKELKVEEVDMLTLVIVGSSETKMIKDNSGKKWVYTPRGYGNKKGG